MPDPGTALVRYTPSGGALAPYQKKDRYPDPESGGFVEYWRNLRHHRTMWFVFTFLGALAGFLIAVPQTPLYEAHTSLEIVGLNENFMNFRPVSPVAETGTTAETFDIQTEIKILQSESLTDRVVAKLASSKRLLPETGGRIAAWRRFLHFPEPTVEAAGLAHLLRIAKTLKVRTAGQTRVVEMTVDSSDPALAAGFANTLASEFIEQNLESRWKATEKTSDWLGHQLDGMRIKLEHSEDALQRYARQSGLIFTDEKTNVASEKLRQLQTELSSATGDRIAKQSRGELALSSLPETLAEVLDDAALREAQLKITELRGQIADLRSVYGTEFSKIKRLQAELDTRQLAFERDRGAAVSRIRNGYKEAARREALLSAAYDAQAKEVSGQGERAIQYNILKREADSDRQLYDSMLQQLKQSTIASAMRASNVRVVDAAKVPTHPFSPNVGQSAGLGMLVGLVMGAAFIVTRERTDRTIHQPGDSPLWLSVPELGVIPSSKSGVGRAAVAESFRSTLLSILFATDHAVRPKALVMTSAGASEGKSMLASNLAIAMAEIEQRVLLIDGDLRRPRLHEIFSMRNERGLSTILRDKTTLDSDQLLSGGLIRESEISGLFVLTSGPPTASATSLLYGAHMQALLKYVRTQFDIILIDTPPMLQIPDARVMARMSDAALIVIRAGKTTREDAMAVRQRLNEDGTAILGTIFNGWSPAPALTGYYGYRDARYAQYPSQTWGPGK